MLSDQIPTGNMSINLGCRNIGMAQKFLHASQIGSVLQQMRCKRMAKRMDFRRQAA